MKCNTMLKELSAQLFAVLLVTLCLSILNVNKSYAFTLDEYVSYLENHASEITETGARTAVEQFIYNVKNLETWQLVMQANWENTECVQASYTYNSNPTLTRRIYMQFKSFPENTKLYKDSSWNWANTPNITYTELIILYNGSGTINEVQSRQVSNNTISLQKSTNEIYTFVSDKFYIYQSQNSDVIYNYYFNDILTHGPKFTKSVHDVVFYENTSVSLGTLQGNYEKSKLQLLLYDVTDPNNLYPPLIAKYGNGISVLGSRVDLESRLVQVGHQYDLYFIYEGETTEQFRYVWRNFMNESGEIIGGYNIQTGVNQLIDYQTSGNQQIISAIESGNKAIISAIESGNKEMISAIESGNKQLISSIESGNKQLISSIESGNKQLISAIESGEKKAEERNNFWKGIYEGLFTIDSGDAQEMVTSLVQNLRLHSETEESGDIELIATITDKLQGEAEDFKISWGNIYMPSIAGSSPMLLISGDNINFSKLCRDNEGLRKAKVALNTIVSTTLLIMCYLNFREQLYELLGTKNRFLDKEEFYYESQAVIIDDQLGPSTYPVPYIYSPDLRDKYYKWKFGGGK